MQEAATRRKEAAEKLQAEKRDSYQAQEAAFNAEVEAKAEVERKIRAERFAQQQTLEEERRRCTSYTVLFQMRCRFAKLTVMMKEATFPFWSSCFTNPSAFVCHLQAGLPCITELS